MALSTIVIQVSQLIRLSYCMSLRMSIARGTSRSRLGVNRAVARCRGPCLANNA